MGFAWNDALVSRLRLKSRHGDGLTADEQLLFTDYLQTEALADSKVSTDKAKFVSGMMASSAVTSGVIALMLCGIVQLFVTTGVPFSVYGLPVLPQNISLSAEYSSTKAKADDARKAAEAKEKSTIKASGQDMDEKDVDAKVAAAGDAAAAQVERIKDVDSVLGDMGEMILTKMGTGDSMLQNQGSFDGVDRSTVKVKSVSEAKEVLSAYQDRARNHTLTDGEMENMAFILGLSEKMPNANTFNAIRSSKAWTNGDLVAYINNGTVSNDDASLWRYALDGGIERDQNPPEAIRNATTAIYATLADDSDVWASATDHYKTYLQTYWTVALYQSMSTRHVSRTLMDDIADALRGTDDTAFNYLMRTKLPERAQAMATANPDYINVLAKIAVMS